MINQFSCFFLFCYKRKLLSEMKIGVLQIFVNTFRLMSYFSTINNNGFENNCNKIYFNQLVARKKNEDLYEGFFDCLIDADNICFTIKFFDKRSHSLFFINHMSNLHSDILSRTFSAPIDSENLPTTRTTTDLINMATRVNHLMIRMKQKGIE